MNQTTPLDDKVTSAEKSIILIGTMVQFTHILDFMLVMPLGPDFAKYLAIPLNKLGLLAAIYEVAGIVSGLIGAFFLDNYPRKRLLIWGLFGLSITTGLCGIAFNFFSMMIARFLAGLCGGLIAANIYAMVIDYVPPSRRGQAFGKLAGGFALASVIGVPLCLEIANWFGWRTPFLLTALVALGVAGLVIIKVPNLTFAYEKSNKRDSWASILSMLKRTDTQWAYGIFFLITLSGFMLIPNISALLQVNLGIDRQVLSWLYFLGGGVSFFSMRLAGKLADSYSPLASLILFTLFVMVAVICGFILQMDGWIVFILFPLMMVGLTGRTVSAQTLSSFVPAPQERGSYMALQSVMLNTGVAVGSLVAGSVPIMVNNRLERIDLLAYLVLALAVVIILAMVMAQARILPNRPLLLRKPVKVS